MAYTLGNEYTKIVVNRLF